MAELVDVEKAVEQLIWHIEQTLGPISTEFHVVEGDSDRLILEHNFRCILQKFRANTARPEGVDRASVIEECAAYLDGYAGGHYMAKSCATALRALLSTSDDTPAAVDRVILLDVDAARLQLWKAIEAVTIGNKWDDKLILENLRKQGFWIALLPTSGSASNAVAGDDLADQLDDIATKLYDGWRLTPQHFQRMSVAVRQAAARLRGEGK